MISQNFEQTIRSTIKQCKSDAAFYQDALAEFSQNGIPQELQFEMDDFMALDIAPEDLHKLIASRLAFIAGQMKRMRLTDRIDSFDHFYECFATMNDVHQNVFSEEMEYYFHLERSVLIPALERQHAEEAGLDPEPHVEKDSITAVKLASLGFNMKDF